MVGVRRAIPSATCLSFTGGKPADIALSRRVWLHHARQPPNVGATRMRLQLTIRRDSAGGLAGIMKAIDQGGREVPAIVEAHGDSVSFAVPAQRVTFAGVLSAAGDSIRGTFVQGQAFPLIFVGSEAAVSTGERQEPSPPFPYQTKDVTFECAAGVRLAGTVDVPPGNGPFSTVIFVTGSGPQDRDEAILGHRPFLVIADYLARHGIASLRYDDRGTGRSTGNFESSTTADFAVDAEAAVQFRQRNTPARVGDRNSRPQRRRTDWSDGRGPHGRRPVPRDACRSGSAWRLAVAAADDRTGNRERCPLRSTP
jgi:hypothetical protein